jgi:hypothetical protein
MPSEGPAPTVVLQQGDVHGQAVVEQLLAMAVTPRCVDDLPSAWKASFATSLGNVPDVRARGLIRSMPSLPRRKLEAELLAWQAFLDGIASDPSIEWLSPLAAIRQADNKLHQMQVAQLLGIEIPATIVPRRVSNIAEALGKAAVVKPLGSGVTTTPDGTQRVFFTTVIDTEALTDDALQAAPVIAQQRIGVDFHLRVVTVARQVWCAALRAEGLALDWREDTNASRHWCRIEPPAAVAHDALKIASAAGIGYSSQDWLQAGDDFYFIDLNPCGKWLFLPDPMNHQITAAIATWLTESV